MAWIPLDLNVTLFAEEIVVYHDGDGEPENTTSLADIFDEYENDLRGGFGHEEAEIYVMTTIKALDAGKAQLLAAIAEMKARET
jgi:hypothetical protein